MSNVQREARLEWVPIEKMRVAEAQIAQRALNGNWVDKLVSGFNLEEMGTPTVNLRDGHYFIIDGQHRIEALRRLGFESDSVECWTYEGMTEEEESERFLTLNNQLAVDAFSKFKIAVNANRPDEVAVNAILLRLNLVATTMDVPGATRAVGTLMKVYRRAGGEVLEQALRIIRNAYGDLGLIAHVIDGIAHVAARHPELDEEITVTRLSKVHGGANGLIQRARIQRERHGGTLAHGVAAAAIEAVNRGRGGHKLALWYREETERNEVA